MNILLLVLAIALVGYVVFVWYCPNGCQASGSSTGSATAVVEKPSPVKKPETSEMGIPAIQSPAPATARPRARAESADSSGSSGPTGYRNPETGESAAVPTNYRFTKRWIKQALVDEGLLDRVYKSEELDEQAAKKVRIALDRFKGIKKYHA